MQSSKWLQCGRVEAEGDKKESREAQNYRRCGDSLPSCREAHWTSYDSVHPGFPTCLFSGVQQKATELCYWKNFFKKFI